MGVTYELSRTHLTVLAGEARAAILRSGDGIARHVERGERWEESVLEAWSSAVEPGTLAVDAGAYTGLYAALASSLRASVLAVEPRPEAVSRMRENLAGCPGVSIVQCALWHVDGRGPLHQQPVPLTSGASLVLRDRGRRVTEVELARLDTLLSSETQRVSAIKMDIEGAEIRAIQGATTTIFRHRPTILVECTPRANIQVIMNDVGPVYRAPEWLDDRNVLLVPR